MHTEDKLQQVMATSAVSAPTGMQQSRSHTSLGSRIRTSANGYRMDYSRTAHSSWGPHVRHAANFRLRSDSTTATGILQARTSQDVTRYLLHATEKTHAILERFAEQMKTYHTFQPSFVEGGVYKTLLPTRRAFGSAAWDSVEKVLDASSSQAVRHNAHNNFLETLQNIPSVKDQLSRKSADTTVSKAFTSEAVSPKSPCATQDKDDALFYLWCRERLSMTSEELRQELLFRDKERANKWRASLASTRQRWQAELEGLLGDARDDAQLPPTPLSPTEKRASEASTELLRQRFEQRMRWEVFCNSETSSKLGSTASSTPALAPAAEIISDYRKNDELQAWMEGRWRHHTHRHENAALRIQCAYRCHRARLRAARRRYTRRVAFMEARRAEEEGTRAWNTALRVMTDELNNAGDSFSTTWRSLNFVFSKLQAKAMARRARKKAEMESEFEINEYAALTIQRVYRGYCGRRMVRMIRFPEVFAQQRRARFEVAVVALQAAWRGSATRARIDRERKAALVIQRLVRLSAARARLHRLRATRRTEVDQSTKRFAAQAVCRFLERIILRRREHILRFHAQAELLQRVTRGLYVRLALHRQQRSLLRLVLWTQRHFRGALGRALAQQRRERRDTLLEHLRREDAATVIKRAWRRSVEAAAKAKNLELSESSNSSGPVMPARSQEEAAVIIQRWFRSVCVMHRARADRDAARRQLLLTESAERILRFYRAFKARTSSSQPKNAPIGCTPLESM
ncbi:uncharacterized protein Tco025E_09377 [Trypanosoma conorhini]|uniref:Uncharacterized protein n=1 Tax=Trypanosoma conorhini TaxID=83891 RepID=A0A422MX29_9TRYP|nr:uncharacterized protein Tco025E_09377 [Trypanosoma conorhini]RNE97721.1 hypothetical protein Tco025E_09377 [Trypanosoma conorhini]